MKTGFIVIGCALLAIVVGTLCPTPLEAQGAAPKYELDPSWPKPLPERWVIGPLGGLCVDAQDHVFLLNRQELLDVDLVAGQKAPPIIELDPAGNVVNSWGDGVIEQPLHSCHFDADNNVWVSADTPSGVVQKFSHDGSKLLLQIGKNGVVDSSDGTWKGKALNSNAAQFFMPSDIAVDRQNGDIYVADGESRGGNLRVAVMDKTGKFLRQLRPEGVDTVHCMALAGDNQLYVCNRSGNRVQVYEKGGVFKKNVDIPFKAYTPMDGKRTATSGAASITLSRDANQKFMYVINQNNSQVEVIDRLTGKILSSFGRSGHFPGQFDQPHGIGVDSKGNLYVSENRGKRVQKFRLVNSPQAAGR